ncbi:lipase chaperone [Rhodococcus hoagii]|nr:lipase chaperone [Prescottella equi]
MTEYVLTALRFNQILERNDQGRAIKEIKHRRGALITDLDELEAERLLKAGAIVPASDLPKVSDTPADDATDTEGEAEAVGAQANPADEQLRRPRATATAEKWAAYAKARGIAADAVDAMDNKDAIIAAVDALDAQ